MTQRTDSSVNMEGVILDGSLKWWPRFTSGTHFESRN